MATQEKLLKSLEVLKNSSGSNQTSDPSKKRDKLQHCHIVTEAISNSTIKIAPNFQTYLSATIEVLLQLCDDNESDVRMTAGDCLNRIIRALNDGNIGKVQLELHKGIKRNGPAKSLRAALKRFSQLAHLIRPYKGKPYVVNLFPTLIKVSERPEEQIHETLANSICPIMKVLGCFASDAEIKELLKGFLKNISHSSAAIRRSAASCVLHVCLNSRKPQVFLNYVVHSLLDLLVPVHDSHSCHLILGVLTCFKGILVHIGSYKGEKDISVDKLLQIYELCLHYFSNKDHNIVNAALEAANILFQHCPVSLKQVLLSDRGIDKSRINLPTSFSTTAFRSPSQLSVATSAATEDLFVESELTDTIRSDIEKWIDESKLSVINVPCAKSELEKSVSLESKTSLDIPLTPFDNFEYRVSEYMEAKSHSVGDNLEMLTLSDESSEKSLSYMEEGESLQLQEVAIGGFLDSDIPLVYCARLINKLFLLSGQSGVCMSDKTVRVSVKSLALSCFASIVKLYPQVLLLHLDKHYSQGYSKNVSNQRLADVMLYENHADPQLRGVLQTVLSNFVCAVLKGRKYEEWIKKNDSSPQFQLQFIVDIIIKGLQDESANCAKQTILSLTSCLEMIAESSSNVCILPVLNVLLGLAANPYWLVKVALCELVSKLPYLTLYCVTGSSVFQTRVIDDVLFGFLQNDDARVRTGAANAIVTIIPHLYYEQFHSQQDAVTAKAISLKNKYLSNLSDKQEGCSFTQKRLLDNMPFPFSEIGAKGCDKIELSLSRLVTKLYHFLLSATSNNFISGCIETLSLLSSAYPTTVYTHAWNCHCVPSTCEEAENLDVSLDLFCMCVYLLSHSVLVYDMSCHLNLLNLSSNLYAGYSLSLLKPVCETDLPTKSWHMFSNSKFSNLAESYLQHMTKLLNIFHHVLDETVPAQLQSKPVLSNLSTASPIKRRKSDLDKKVPSPNKSTEKDDRDKKDAKSNAMGSFVHSPHYIKIFEIARQAYTNYKVTLESESSGKFQSMLNQTLRSLSVIMETGTLTEFQGIAEEILNYFRHTFVPDASGTVECVQQLLKCLFGNNLTNSIDVFRSEADRIPALSKDCGGFYYNVYQKSYDEISKCLALFRNIQVECDGDTTVMGYLHRKDAAPLVSRSSDKALASYIRIFEPIVIKSLKHYTITSDVRLQCRVLQLLNQLIQLRVNYCLLDSEQIFIGFILKQFDYIENGQIPFAAELVRKIFQFLVQLSYSKQHSKNIITVPKIIHLCDGLMASEQSPLTHCIPALEPIVENIFLSRNKSNTGDLKELETTRDVVLSMLLRLYEHHEVIDLIVLILDDSKYCNNSEKWFRWSAQVMDVILPMLQQNKIRMESSRSFASLRRLMFVLEPSVFEPIDSVILILFQEPLDYETWQTSFTRRLGKILIAFLILSSLKEDLLISKINDLKAHFAPESVFENRVTRADPLNVLNSLDIFEGISPETIFVKFLFKVLTLASRYCLDGNDFQIEEVSMFLMHCIHIFQSGSHCKIAIYASTHIDEISVEEISRNFFEVCGRYPVLMFLWCYLLTLLNYADRSFWGEVFLTESASVNDKVTYTGSVIMFCDYMNQDGLKSEQLLWCLKDHVLKIVELCNEDPISDFISSVHRNNLTSKIFIHSLANKRLTPKNPVFTLKLLKAVENAHAHNTGSVLKLLLPELLQSKELSVARCVAKVATRKTELLLSMSVTEVHEQLGKEDLVGIVKSLIRLELVERHKALSSLLSKLCAQSYDVSPLESDQKRLINPLEIKELEINKDWFLSQIKNSSKETAQLLSRLDYEELSSFLKSSNCFKTILRECLSANKQSPLVEASVECLLTEIRRICERTKPEVHAQGKNIVSSALFEDAELVNSLYEVIPSVILFVHSLPNLSLTLSDTDSIFIIQLVVVCLELPIFIASQADLNVNCLELSVSCAEAVLNETDLCNVLNSNSLISWLCSLVNSLYKIVEYLLNTSLPIECGLQAPVNDDSMFVGESCHKLYTLVSWLYKNQNAGIPKFLFKSLKNIIIDLSRLSVFNSYILIPPQVWKSGWSSDLLGPFHTQVHPLPIEFLLEVDVLEEYISRIILLGWTSRQQFEETWMSLLSVLCSHISDKDALLAQEAVHASCLAVKAITALLAQTLYTPAPGRTNVSMLTHVPRSPSLEIGATKGIEELKNVQDTIERRHKEKNLCNLLNVFNLPNLERSHAHYSYSQVSVKYLLIATKTVTVEDCLPSKIWKHREALLETSGLDINSCLQFLLDYYTQLLNSENATPLRFLYEIVRSTVIISDLFTDKAQFTWMLDIFLELSKTHSVEDELLHQYLVVGIAKAVAVLTPDLEVYESIKKLTVQYLKSSFLPSRIACLHGLLYMLEGCKLSNICIGGISDEMQILLPCAMDYVQSNIQSPSEIFKRSEEHTVLVWTLAFYLIESLDEGNLEPNFVTNSLQAAFSALSTQNLTRNLQTTLMKALERLVIVKKSVMKNLGKQIMSLALEKIKSDNPLTAVMGIHLLLTYLYTDCSEQLIAGNTQTNPDNLVQTIEKVSALFEHIRHGYVFEVDILCYVLPTILNDFFSPADILTKVISEFLSPQQPHPKFLSGVVFHIFARAIENQQLSLLQDWVVFSLSNFTQSLSVGMATWCLTCFFISASTNEWLRLVFPYVQTRVGRYEYEDRRMLCIAGSDFYRNLTSAKQKETFVENFKKVKDQPDKLFNDLLSSL